MITFTVNNILTHVDNPHPIAHAVGKYLNIKSDSFYKGIDYAEYRATGKSVLRTKYKADYINVYNQMKQTFPTGRLGYLVDWCRDNGIPCQVIDNRIMPEKHLDIIYTGPPSDGSNGKPSRPYQLNAPSILRERGGRGILWHATGSGKTCTGARIIQDFGVTTLYMVPSIELLDQTAKALRAMLSGILIGTIGDGTWDPQSITVATSATLWSRFHRQECKDFLNSIELLITDECHHVTRKGAGTKTKNKEGKGYKVNSWYILAINCPAYFRVGLTGTPGKDIEQKRSLLECVIGRVVDRVSVRELIDVGILSEVEIHMHTITHSVTRSDYPSARREGVLLNEEFNRYLVQIAIAELKAGESVLMLTGSKAHQGPLLVKLFQEYGYEVPFVSGDDTRKNRIRFREDFRNGKIKALVGTVYREGVDFPYLTVGILCDGGQDEKATCQFLGRILRTAEGKTKARLHDAMHKDKKFLQRHSNARLTEYVEQELENIVTHKGITV